MTRKLIVICRHPLLRQALVQRLVPLGMTVFAFDRVEEAVREINSITPDGLLIDVDGMEQVAMALLGGIRRAGKAIPSILLAGSLSIDEANELLALGVRGIILKPFDPATHIRRIMHIFHRVHGTPLRRRHPRFSPHPSERASVTCQERQRRRSLTFSVKNISRGGMFLEAVHYSPETALEELQRGNQLPAAELRMAGWTVRSPLTVVHVSGTLVGVRFQEEGRSRSRLADYLDTLCQNVYGTVNVDWKC